ncbi:Zinc finger BED domain-containing protein 1 [Merluccius polli]|uniref:Zinc finger BED domain-containing protein 1 n=1 Tax=Merluccius polli TaxID=89951 RepID=A0AA47M5Z0_MERPO|nr:Zinc finger BED domain-containing protein 1 [Merluccius polli]
MLARLHEQRWAVTAVLSDRTVTKLSEARTLEMTDDNWQTIETMLPVLESLKTATTTLRSEEYISLSMVFPITMRLLDRYLVISADDSTVVSDFKKTVATSLRKRMEPDNTERAGRAALLASALDPRHKHLRFLPLDVQAAVKQQLVIHYDGLAATVHVGEDGGACEEASGMSLEPGPSRKRKKTTLSAFFGEDYAEGEPSDDELERYWADPPVPLTEDPLMWWSGKERSFPKVYMLAMRFLCVPATSVPAERVFSAAGLIVSRLRSRLLPKHVDIGKSKPSPLEDYLKDFLTEYKHLKDNGIVYKGQTYTVNIDALICDAPARAYLKCIKGHASYESCERCIIRGTRVEGRMVFSEQQCTSRTDDRFSRVEYKNHQTDVSPFIAAGIPCVSSFVLDYMHMVCLGVVRRLLIYLTRGPKICLSVRQRDAISQKRIALRKDAE